MTVPEEHMVPINPTEVLLRDHESLYDVFKQNNEDFYIALYIDIQEVVKESEMNHSNLRLDLCCLVSKY